MAWLLAAIASAAYPPQWHEADGAPVALGGAYLRGIAFGGEKFVVVPAYDAEGKLTSATSQDGMAWTKGRPFPVQKQLHSVASNGNFFVGVGYAGVALSSVDGLDWTAGTSGVTADLNGVAYGAGKFVAVGPSGKVLTSTNGITWMTTILPADLSYSNFDTIEFGNGKFIIPYGSSSIMTSDDGLVWTKKRIFEEFSG